MAFVTNNCYQKGTLCKYLYLPIYQGTLEGFRLSRQSIWKLSLVDVLDVFKPRVKIRVAHSLNHQS